MTKTATLTISKATTQAAGRVRQVMAGALVTASSRMSYDLTSDKPLVITSVTFPPTHPGALDARAALLRLAGVRSVDMGSGTGYATVVREA